MRVDDGGDRVVVDVALLSSEELGNGDTLFFGLVRKHGSADDISDGEDVAVVGLEVGVGQDSVSVVELDSDLLGTETLSEWGSSGGDEDVSAFFGDGGSSSNGLVGDLCVISVVDDLGDLVGSVDLDSLLGEDSVEGLGDLSVSNGDDSVSVLDDGDLGSESLVDLSHLDSDDSSSDDDHGFRDLVEGEGSSGGNYDFFVEGGVRERDSVRSGRQDDVLGVEGLGSACEEVDVDGVLVSEFSPSLDIVDFVFLEQSLDTTGQRGDNFPLLILDLGPIEVQALDRDSEILEVQVSILVLVGDIQQGLRWDTSDIKAGSS